MILRFQVNPSLTSESLLSKSLNDEKFWMSIVWYTFYEFFLLKPLFNGNKRRSKLPYSQGVFTLRLPCCILGLVCYFDIFLNHLLSLQRTNFWKLLQVNFKVLSGLWFDWVRPLFYDVLTISWYLLICQYL